MIRIHSFFVPEVRDVMVGWLGEYNTCAQEIAKAVPVAVSTHPTAKLSCNVEIATGEIMKNRKLKVRPGFYDYQFSAERRRRESYKTSPAVPFILLKGYWLEKANFLIDKPVNVEVRDGRLILTVEEG